MGKPIVDTVRTGGTPAAVGVPATPARTATLRALPTQDYVAGGRWNWLQNVPKALPFAFDDLTADFGDDVYHRMLFDPMVASAVHTLKAAIFADGVEVVPAVTDKTDAAQARAQVIADFVRADMERLDPSLDDSLWSLGDAIWAGSKVAEQVYRLDGGALRLAALKVKERRTTAFVVDAYLNVIGLLGLIPGQPMPIVSSYLIGDPARTPNLLPREKFAVLSYWPRDGDPRGTSILRAAYRPWWDKQQTIPEYLKYLAQFAGPSIIATAPEGVLPYLPTDELGNATGGPVASVEQQMAAQLATFRNGTYLVLPYGATAKPVEVAGDGQAFTLAFERFDRQISIAILHQTLATGEAQHSSRSQATVHQDVMAILVRMGKRAVARMLEKDVFAPLVRYNFGDDAAATLVPAANLGDVEAEDLSPRMAAIAQMAAAGLILPSQLPEIYSDLGLPQGSPEEFKALLDKFVAPPPPPPAPGAQAGPPPGTPAPPKEGDDAPPRR